MNLDRDINDVIIVAKVDTIKNYRKWSKEIPALKFPSDWNITMVPPFGGAMVRFCVTRDAYPGKSISVYLDCDDSLGCVGRPYWEIYPFKGDTCRFFLNETDELLNGIDLAFGNQRKILTKS